MAECPNGYIKKDSQSRCAGRCSEMINKVNDLIKEIAEEEDVVSDNLNSFIDQNVEFDEVHQNEHATKLFH